MVEVDISNSEISWQGEDFLFQNSLDQPGEWATGFTLTAALLCQCLGVAINTCIYSCTEYQQEGPKCPCAMEYELYSNAKCKMHFETEHISQHVIQCHIVISVMGRALYVLQDYTVDIQLMVVYSKYLKLWRYCMCCSSVHMRLFMWWLMFKW